RTQTGRWVAPTVEFAGEPGTNGSGSPGSSQTNRIPLCQLFAFCQAANPLQQAKNTAFVGSQLLSDLGSTVPLHAHFQDLALLWPKLTEEMFELVQESVDGFGVWLRIERLRLA